MKTILSFSIVLYFSSRAIITSIQTTETFFYNFTIGQTYSISPTIKCEAKSVNRQSLYLFIKNIKSKNPEPTLQQLIAELTLPVLMQKIADHFQLIIEYNLLYNSTVSIRFCTKEPLYLILTDNTNSGKNSHWQYYQHIINFYQINYQTYMHEEISELLKLQKQYQDQYHPNAPLTWHHHGHVLFTDGKNERIIITQNYQNTVNNYQNTFNILVINETKCAKIMCEDINYNLLKNNNQTKEFIILAFALIALGIECKFKEYQIIFWYNLVEESTFQYDYKQFSTHQVFESKFKRYFCDFIAMFNQPDFQKKLYLIEEILKKLLIAQSENFEFPITNLNFAKLKKNENLTFLQFVSVEELQTFLNEPNLLTTTNPRSLELLEKTKQLDLSIAIPSVLSQSVLSQMRNLAIFATQITVNGELPNSNYQLSEKALSQFEKKVNNNFTKGETKKISISSDAKQMEITTYRVDSTNEPKETIEKLNWNNYDSVIINQSIENGLPIVVIFSYFKNNSCDFQRDLSINYQVFSDSKNILFNYIQLFLIINNHPHMSFKKLSSLHYIIYCYFEITKTLIVIDLDSTNCNPFYSISHFKLSGDAWTATDFPQKLIDTNEFSLVEESYVFLSEDYATAQEQFNNVYNHFNSPQNAPQPTPIPLAEQQTTPTTTEPAILQDQAK